jgi:hypothetical protein
MKNIERIAEELFDKIRSRFEHVVLGAQDTDETDDPEQARFFNFDYISNTGINYGNLTLSLVDEDSLKIYFSQTLSDKLDGNEEDQNEWYNFLKGLRFFAKRNLLKFDTRDISRSNLTVRDLKQASKSTSAYTTADTPGSVTESRLTGTSKVSTQNFGPSRLVIHHSEAVNEEIPGSRSRKIDRMYVETELGERFLMPFKKLSAGRAMAEHIAHGGLMYDQAGAHIVGMVEEMDSLAFFARNTRRRMFEDGETQAMVEAAISRYHTLKDSLKRMSGPRGYEAFAESFQPVAPVEEEYDIDALKERFVKKMFDDRLTQALPYVHRAYQQSRTTEQNSYVREFDDWADDVTENKTLDIDMEGLATMMQEPVKVGTDGIDAISVVKDFIPSDDQLFSEITELSRTMGVDADARDLINSWLINNGHQSIPFQSPGMSAPEPDQAPVPKSQPEPDQTPVQPKQQTLEQIKRLAGI